MFRFLSLHLLCLALCASLYARRFDVPVQSPGRPPACGGHGPCTRSLLTQGHCPGLVASEHKDRTRTAHVNSHETEHARFDRDGRFDLWLHAELNKKIHEKAKLSFQPELRFRDNGNLYLYYFQARFHLEITRNIELAPGYRQIYVRAGERRHWRPVYSPLVDLIFKRKLLCLHFDTRNRLQYLIFERGVVRWRYRLRYRVRAPICLFGIVVEPNVHNEIFFREKAGLDENRLAFGVAIPNLHFKVEYMLNTAKRVSKWRQINVLSLSTYFTF